MKAVMPDVNQNAYYFVMVGASVLSLLGLTPFGRFGTIPPQNMAHRQR